MTDRRAAVLSELSALEVRRAELFAELVALHLHREPEDRLLTVEEAAAVLNVTVDWLYRHANDFSFTVRPGPGQVRFSNIGVQHYLRKERT